jgi:hypothetical protein
MYEILQLVTVTKTYTFECDSAHSHSETLKFKSLNFRPDTHLATKSVN